MIHSGYTVFVGVLKYPGAGTWSGQENNLAQQGCRMGVNHPSVFQMLSMPLLFSYPIYLEIQPAQPQTHRSRMPPDCLPISKNKYNPK